MSCYQNKERERNELNLMAPQDAFMLGNIDNELYCPYKGFTNYPLIPQTKRGQLLSEVMMYDFNAHEMNLYLDTHPCDRDAFAKLLKFQKKAHEARMNYENCFGALTVSNLNDSQGYNWICGPWPWQRQ